MQNVSSLINTSVTDAASSLESGIEHRPAEVARVAVELLEALQGKEGQASRRKMAATIARKALKQLERGPQS
ncbi:hypothetical protein [Chromohalobacter israelensis]|uniref:hypothetical protein n=1 Tax=Chromohalobacter israelensis TaxID=141390 RepID=UPI0005599DCB|nr:hypothetical protein [Chromohalobacter israelensis]MDF9432991.1 hypothetical protein [Chromohalobacter israelensis]